jgi:hypothetical protein
MIAELSNGHRAGIHWPDAGVDFRETPDYGAPHSGLIRVLLDGADNLLVVKTFAARTDLGPAKLPDLRTTFAIESLHTTMLHLSPPAAAEQKNLQVWEQLVEISRVNCLAAAML